LEHGRSEDIRNLDFGEIEQELDLLNLPGEIDSLWRNYLEYRREQRQHPGR
jgi:hypothetical protein